jgi:hypothetical protein
MRNDNVHATLLAAVGGYILYLAYRILENFRGGAKEMPDFLYVIVIAVMALGGIGTIWYAWTVYARGRKAEKEKPDQEKDRAED